jgi:hypothetical protein
VWDGGLRGGFFASQRAQGKCICSLQPLLTGLLLLLLLLLLRDAGS